MANKYEDERFCLLHSLYSCCDLFPIRHRKETAVARAVSVPSCMCAHLSVPT